MDRIGVQMKHLAVITARSGSKGLKDKKFHLIDWIWLKCVHNKPPFLLFCI